tara:strand:- start:10 stop:519 length:510 start_codon:yes stop_codon:yes gene_type:complete
MAYPAKVWAKVKADYETGNFSIDKMGEKYGISTATIEKRIKADKWQKGKLKPIIEKKIEETTAEMFARLGLPKEKLLDKIIEGTDANRTYIKRDGSGEGFVEVEPDHAARVKYITEINKMTGGYTPEKQEITAKNTNIEVTTDDLEGLSDEEIEGLREISEKLTKPGED